MTIECPTCGNSFDSNHGMRVHHAHKHGESLVDSQAECVVCGETFQTYEPDRRTTCSQECNRENISKRQQGEDHWNWKGGLVEVECEVCGDFYTVKQYKEDRTSTCSNECNGVKAGQANSESIEKDCAVCGDAFETCRSAYDRRTTCSMDCLSEYLSGQGHPRWKEGVGYGSEWDNISDLVRDKYDNTCEVCGKRSDEKLPVHHIIPVREFDNVSDAHFDENLIVLCRSCHGKVEWSWSLEKQIEEFNRDPDKLQV